MAEPTSQFSLPRSKSEWRAARKRYECQTMTIHNLKAPNSASEIRREQFLALNVIWPNQRQTQAEDYLTSIGFQKGVFEEKRKAMKARKAWEMYLEILKDNARAASLRKGKPWTLDSALSDELGGFQLVLISQLEVLALPDDIGTDQSKVTVTSRPDVSPPIAPVTPRLERLRVRTQNPSYVSTEPATPVRQDVFRPTEEMSARKSEDTRVPDAADEQIVNTALVEFLNALWANEKRIAGWSLKRKEFRFHPQGPGAGFVARTDGHLQVSVQSAGILEVKARARPRKDPADHKIEMQESAQMALWIAQEPNSHWTSPKKGPHGKQTIYQ